MKKLLGIGMLIAALYWGSTPFLIIGFYVYAKFFTTPGSKIYLRTEKFENDMMNWLQTYIKYQIQHIDFKYLFIGACIFAGIVIAALIITLGSLKKKTFQSKIGTQ